MVVSGQRTGPSLRSPDLPPGSDKVFLHYEHRNSTCILEKLERLTHGALVWLLSRVPAHMNHQHVLGFEGPLLSRALLPVTHKLLLFSVNVLIVDVLQSKQIGRKTDVLTESVQ